VPEKSRVVLLKSVKGRLREHRSLETCGEPAAAVVADGELFVACRKAGLIGMSRLMDAEAEPRIRVLAADGRFESMVAADVDGDGSADIAAGEMHSGSVWLWRSGHGEPMHLDAGRAPVALAAVDVNGDGAHELASLAFEDRKVLVLSQPGEAGSR
jgi:hypothetical protein